MMDELATQCIVEVWPARPTSGQHCGIASNGIKVTHEPTGLTATCDLARSQHGNKVIALDMIMTALTHPKTR